MWLTVLACEIALAAGMSALANLLMPTLPCLLLSGVAAGLCMLLVLRRTVAPVRPNRPVREIGLTVSGLCIGASVSLSAVAQAGPMLLLYAALALASITIGCLLSLVFSTYTSSGRCAALLILFPGATGAVISIAEGNSKESSTVSAVQVFRVASVLMIVAAVANVHGVDVPTGFDVEPVGFVPLVIFVSMIVPTWLVWWALRRLSTPLPGFFAGLLVGFGGYAILLPSVAMPVLPPEVVVDFGQLLLGIAAGESIGAGLRLRARTGFAGAIGVLLTAGGGLGAAAVLHAVAGLDWLTCVLMTAPGSPSEITMFALTLPVNIEHVVLAQVVRQLVTNLALSPLVKLFSRLERRAHGASSEVGLEDTSIEQSKLLRGPHHAPSRRSNVTRWCK